jgi:low affinity Fe/Cu permease
MQKWFAEAANAVSHWTGSSWAFMIAFATIIVWVVSGPVFGFSDTWQLVINTGTTIVTFLMVFLIQNTQNRDQRALQLKLDELLRAVEGAREQMFAGIEERDEQRLEEVREELRAECGVCATADEHERDPEHRLRHAQSDSARMRQARKRRPPDVTIPSTKPRH